MKKLFFIVSILSSFFNASAQVTYTSIVKPRIDCLGTTTSHDSTSNYIVLKNDTLYAKPNSLPNLNYLNTTTYNYEHMLKYYERIVFCYISYNPPVTYELMQWNSDIIIYLDKKLPKEVVSNFKTFISNSQLNAIANLNIRFTKNIENANYFIKTTTETVNGYGDDYEFESEEERENNMLTGATYNLITDGNNKFFGGVLKINIGNSKTNTKLLKQIKQLFYKSLGNFIGDNYKETNSLLHDNYDNSESISEFDYDIIKIQYSVIYDQKINGSKFKSLLKLAKKLN